MNVLMIRSNNKGRSNGIDAYCKGLYTIFKDSEEINILEVSNYPVHKLRLVNDIYKRGIEKVIGGNDVDVVHINGYTSFTTVQAIWLARKYGKKIVYTAHWHPFETLNRPFFAKVFFRIFLKTLISRFVDIVVTINNEDTEYFKGFHSNVFQIPHWNRLDGFDDIKYEKKSDMILFVGKVDSQNKGIDHIYSLPEGKYDIHCVGSGNMTLRSDITYHRDITEEEIVTLYKQASLLVVPSKYEAFSYATLEALYYGTPVLISNGVRIGDYLDGVKGVSVFNYGDYEGFAKMVDSQKGKEVDIAAIKSIFDLKRIKNLYETVYISVVE